MLNRVAIIVSAVDKGAMAILAQNVRICFQEIIEGVVQKTHKSMLIPYEELMPATLRNVLLEIVSRDGTDFSSIDQRIFDVQRQLSNGSITLHFDSITESFNIVVTNKNHSSELNDELG